MPNDRLGEGLTADWLRDIAAKLNATAAANYPTAPPPEPPRQMMGPPDPHQGENVDILEEQPKPPVVPMDIYRQVPGTQTYAGPPVRPPSGAMGPPAPSRSVDLTPGPDNDSLKEWATTPVLPVKEIGNDLDSFLVGPFDWLHRSAIDAAMGTTTPLNAAITLGTMGLSGIAEGANVTTQAAAKAVQAGVSTYFATEAGKSALAKAPEIADAYSRGDYAAMFKAGGQTLVDGVFATAAALHAATSGLGAVEGLARVPKTGTPPGMLPSEAGVLKLPDFSEGLKTFEDKWIDELAPIRRLEERGNVAPGASAYEAARDYAGHSAQILARHIEARRILRPVEAAGLTDDLNRYLELKTHQESFATKPNYKAPGGLTPAGVVTELSDMGARLGPDRMAQVEQSANQTRLWSDNVLRTFRDSGMISNDAYDAMTKPGHQYAPLQRLAYLDDIDNTPIGGRTFNVRRQPVVKERVGSEKEIIPPLEGFLRNVDRMTVLAEKNRVTARIGDMAQEPAFNGIVRPLTGKMAPGPGEGTVTTFRGGVKESYAVPKPVADAVAGMAVSDADLMMKWAKWVAATNRLMITGSTTLNPAFIGRNIIRDVKTATLRSTEAPKPGGLGVVGFTPVDWAKGFWSALTRDDYFEKYLDSGGAMSGFFERQGGTQESMSRILEPQWKRVGRQLTPWGLIQAVAKTTELAPRVGYFRMLDEQGNLPLETMGFKTRNSTTDFSRSGSSMRVANLWAPMLNARKEGLVNTLAAFKSNPVKAATVLTAIAGIPTVASYFHNVNNYPNVWKDLKQTTKDANHILIFGDRKEVDGDGNVTYPDVAMMPKNDIWAAYSNVLEHSLEWLRGTDQRAFGEMALQVASDTSPVDFARKGHFSGQAIASTLLPPIFKGTVVEPIANRNLFTDRQIETDVDKKGPPEKRYTINAPTWVVKAGTATKYLGISPKMLQNMIMTQFGGAGRMAVADVRPERNETMERTGLGQAVRAFSGAPGGGIEEKEFNAAEPIATQVAGVRLDRDREAQRLWVKVHAAPADQRAKIVQDSFRSGETTMDLPTFERFMDTLEAGVKGMTPYERWLKPMPAESRAPILVNQLDRLPAEEIGTFFKRLGEVGVVNDEVAEKMGEIYAKRGHGPKSIQSAGRTPSTVDDRSPLDKALGIPLTTPLPPKELSPLDRALGIK